MYKTLLRCHSFPLRMFHLVLLAVMKILLGEHVELTVQPARFIPEKAHKCKHTFKKNKNKKIDNYATSCMFKRDTCKQHVLIRNIVTLRSCLNMAQCKKHSGPAVNGCTTQFGTWHSLV